jgi:hypothetical protein
LSGVLVLNDRPLIVSLLLLEVFVVALCLIVECLAVLEYLYLIFIELDLLVVLDRLEHHLFGIVFEGDYLLSAGQPAVAPPAEISALHIEDSDLLPHGLNLRLLFHLLVETTQLVEERVDEGEEFLLEVGDHVGEFLVVDEIQRIHEDLGELVLLLLTLDGVGAKYEEGEGPQELILIGDTGLGKVEDRILLVLFVF